MIFIETTEQIKVFQDFLEDEYYEILLDKSTKDDRNLYVDFRLLAKFNPQLADELLEYPDEVIKAGEIATEHMELSGDRKRFKLRLTNIPESCNANISDIRSKHIHKLVRITGVIKIKTKPTPYATTIRYECPSCGNIIPMLQLSEFESSPTRCGCGRKGKFRELSRDRADVQKMIIEEDINNVLGTFEPKKFKISLKDDLANEENDKITLPGSKIAVIGIIREVKIMRQNRILTKTDLVLDAISFEMLDQDSTQITFTEDDIKNIKNLARRKNIMEDLVQSFSTTIVGHEKIKEALLLQLVGGNLKVNPDGVRVRGEIHILLIGDPGSGKSQLLNRSGRLAQRSRSVAGNGASGGGLTAIVKKDELGSFSLEAGAMPLSHKGLCIIDELDKMSDEDSGRMHEAMEQQIVSVNKGGISAKLKAEASVLCAANPGFGRFDPNESVPKQIKMPPALINRFDVIFPIRDIPDQKKDKMVSARIFGLIPNEDPKVDTDLLRKYLAYAKNQIQPEITKEAMTYLQSFFLGNRNPNCNDMGNIQISYRQCDALYRFAEASAKIRLSKKVTVADAERSVLMIQAYLYSVGFDQNSGCIDLDKISGVIPGSERNNINIAKRVIKDLDKKNGGNAFGFREYISACQDKDLTDDQAIDAMDILLSHKMIFKPTPKTIKKL